jgi:virulence factor Mce-like protein
VLTRFIKIQLVLFTILTIIAIVALGWYYLRVPSLVGIGQYKLYADLPRSGGLYATGNVTYRGTQIGKVTAVEPTENGARATMSIDSTYKIPVDATANVHSVSAIGEQYLDLVSTGNPGQYLSEGQNVGDRSTNKVPSEVGPALDSANRGLAVLPKEKIDSLLTETSQAVGGLGPALQRLVDSTTNIAQGFKDNLPQVNDIIAHSTPILDSQVNSGDNIERWARNLNIIAAQSAEQDAALRSGLEQAAPTLDQTAELFSGVRDSLPQTLANLSVVIDMLKRYHKGLEQTLVILPHGTVDQPAAAVSDRFPAGLGMAITRRHQHGAAAHRHLLQDSKGLPGQRGSRRPQLSLRGYPGQAGGHAEGVPQQRAVCAAGHQPLVRRSEPDLVLPRARSALRPGCQSRAGRHSGADGQQRAQSATGEPTAAAGQSVGTDQRSAEPAWPGHGSVQWTATQPVHVHSGTRATRLHRGVQPDQW